MYSYIYMPPPRYVRTSAFDAYAPSVAGRPSYKLAGGAAGGAAGGVAGVGLVRDALGAIELQVALVLTAQGSWLGLDPKP